jgi:hypothetical protein
MKLGECSGIIVFASMGLLFQIKEPPIHTRMIYDSSGHLVETIKQYRSGDHKSESIYDSSGHRIGYINQSGTYDAEGHKLSSQPAPELLHPK